MQGIPEHIILSAIEDITYIRKKEDELKERVAERMIELKKIITELEEDVLSFKKTDIPGT